MNKTEIKTNGVCMSYADYALTFLPKSATRSLDENVQPFKMGVTLARESLVRQKKLLIAS